MGIDRDGRAHQFPKINTRIPEGEEHRLSKDIYDRWGSEIGASEVVSRRYEPDEDGFPNHWIGQREGSPEPSLERAKSPRAFFYRTLAGRSHHAPGTEAKEAFEAACDYSLEVYKANFPTAVDPRDQTTEYVVIEEATEPWNDFQVPPQWIEEYSSNGGFPPLKRASNIPEKFDSEVRDAIEKHSPGGEGFEWFDSLEEAVEVFEQDFYRDLLVATSNLEYSVVDFWRGGAAHPNFGIEIQSTSMEITVDTESCLVQIDSETGGDHKFRTDGKYISDWGLPRTSNPAKAHKANEEMANLFGDVATIVETCISAMSD